jgi:hypothetical protein
MVSEDGVGLRWEGVLAETQQTRIGIDLGPYWAALPASFVGDWSFGCGP